MSMYSIGPDGQGIEGDIWEKYHKKNPDKVNRIGSLTSFIKYSALSAMILLATSGNTKAGSTGEHSSEEISQQGNLISSLLRLEIYGIPTFDLSEYTDESTRRYYIQTLDDPSIGTQTGMILRHISEEMGITFGWIDIPNIADLVTAKYSGDRDTWEKQYETTLQYYPVFADKLGELLTTLGYNPFQTEA